MMRRFLLVLVVLASQAAAQLTPSPAPEGAGPPTPAAPWNPAGPYITQGQDEPGYRSWYVASSAHASEVRSFNDYLVTNEVSGILPTWELLRTASSWKDCGQQPFEVPPTSEWPHIVQTLRYIHDYVIPAVGPVEPVSGYRNPILNVCAGGAPESAHKHYSAIDMVPLTPITREDLERKLCAIHTAQGARYGVGLGFYAYLRFHVDTTKFRRWGTDPTVAQDCPPIIHPDDIASVYIAPQQPPQPNQAPQNAAVPAPVVAAPAPVATPPTSAEQPQPLPPKP